MTSSQNKLPQNFYYQNVHDVAKKLLGKYFVRKLNGKNLIGKIVEVEAYDGRIDKAAHSFNGKTKRNEVMFNGGGNLYVYFTYGMHFCSNVVTGKPGDGTAILLRALEPVEGIAKMALSRFGKKDISEKEKINLTNGPAKICIALNIQREDNGKSLNSSDIFIIDEKDIRPEQIFTTTRIGIKKSVDLPWRYYIKDNRYVSKK